MCNFPAAPSPQRRTPRAVFQTPFVSNHPFSQINSEAHKVMLHLPSPLMTGATFKCKQLPFDSPDVTLVQEGDLQLQRRTGWFWQRRVFKEKHPEHKTWKVAHLRDPSSNSFFYYGQKQTGWWVGSAVQDYFLKKIDFFGPLPLIKFCIIRVFWIRQEMYNYMLVMNIMSKPGRI